MNHKAKFLKILKGTVSYVLVAALASAGTWVAAEMLPNSKLERLSAVIDRQFIGSADQTRMQDAAAEAMIEALGDRWSYYISAEEYAAHLDRQSNSYVGIGVTVQKHPEDKGLLIVAVNPDGPAAEAGILPEDIITHADGTFLGQMTLTEGKNLIIGEKNAQVVLTDTVGYVVISNFHEGAGKETVNAVEKVLEQGAETLIFDVRNNPGGYVHEMVRVLDYLLPEGPLFRSVSYKGVESVEESDADCLDLPMAVLINGNTYSAAEFFAAALSEYDWAVTVGEPTCGKGYYQTTIELGDGSAVQLSTGAYTTPNGVNLTEVGGLKPDVPVDPPQMLVSLREDPQIMAALDVLEEETK